MSNDNTTKDFPEMSPPILSELIEDQKRFNAGKDKEEWKVLQKPFGKWKPIKYVDGI